MCVCLCVYICVFVCVYLCECTYLCVCVYLCEFTYLCVCVSVHICVYLFVCMCVLMGRALMRIKIWTSEGRPRGTVCTFLFSDNLIFLKL